MEIGTGTKLRFPGMDLSIRDQPWNFRMDCHKKCYLKEIPSECLRFHLLWKSIKINHIVRRYKNRKINHIGKLVFVVTKWNEARVWERWKRFHRKKDLKVWKRDLSKTNQRTTLCLTPARCRMAKTKKK